MKTFLVIIFLAIMVLSCSNNNNIIHSYSEEGTILHCKNGDVQLGDSTHTVFSYCGTPVTQNIAKNPFIKGDKCWSYDLINKQRRYICLCTFDVNDILYRIDLFASPDRTNPNHLYQVCMLNN